MYDKILIFYFTGTGHTEFLVKKFKKEFEKLSVTCDLCDVTDISENNGNLKKFTFNDYSLLGFAYPVHAFNTPKNFYKFVKRLQVKNKPCFIIKNSREALHLNDSSSLKIISSLKRKGCTILSEYHFLTPYNIHLRNDDRLVKQMLLKLDESVPKTAKEITEGKKVKFSHGFVSRVVAPLFRIEWFGAKLIGKKFKQNDNCVLCGKCVDDCPNHNVKIVTDKKGNKKLDFGFNCMICMRCVFKCPKDGISMGLLKGWKLNGEYDFDRILNDDNIKPNFIDQNSKGFLAKTYKDYFLYDKRF